MSLVNQIHLPQAVELESIFLSQNNDWHQTAKRYKKGAMIYLQDDLNVNLGKVGYMVFEF